LHERAFTAVACDKHPDYFATRYAATLGLPQLPIQHHLAHVLACLLEHRRAADDVLGVSWDGTGYGEDGTIWGGEFLLLRNHRAVRFGRLGTFRLPGGDAAAREPRRVALSLLHALQDHCWDGVARGLGFRLDEAELLRIMLSRGLNAPMSSSIGRLFDGVGALLQLGRHNQFEGQIPLAVEAAAVTAANLPAPVLPIRVRDLPVGAGANCELDWHPMLEALLLHQARGADSNVLALAFHRALIGGILAMARRAGVGTIALSGGCFQNTLLLDLAVDALRAERFEVLTHRNLPPNDGNIAAGQALGALWNLSSVELP
jgi:hydrogenase maturation protein HypF